MSTTNNIDESAVQSEFEKAVYLVRNGQPIRDFTNAEKLKIYAFYKQATIGDVQGSQPWALQVEARAKWDAWNEIKGIKPIFAKIQYVEFVDSIDPDWRNNPIFKE